MRRTWIGVILSMVLLLSAVGQVSAAPGPQKIRTSCGTANGTAKSPHKLCHLSDLNLLRLYPDHHFFLSKNITIIGEWVPIENFSGKFNGNHKSIHNLTNVFIMNNYGSIANLNLKNVTISDFRFNHIGAFSGYNYGRLFNVNVYGDIYGWSDMGGLTYYNNGTIERSTINANVKSNIYAGGLASINGPEGMIKRSSFRGTVSSSGGGAGGIAGNNRGLIKDAIALGKVSVTCCTAGGIVGSNSGEIMNTISAADVHFVENRHRIGKFAGVNIENYGKIIRPLILNHIYMNGVRIE